MKRFAMRLSSRSGCPEGARFCRSHGKCAPAGRPLRGKIPRSCCRGYTLVELFLTLAVLMIILGLMRNLANRVRGASADQLTRQVLAQLTAAMADYQTVHHELPPVQSVAETGQAPSEYTLQLLARQNNADFVRYLHLDKMAKTGKPGNDAIAQSMNAGVLEDPWGSPIVFMPSQHPAIGMAPGDAFFFVSAGPDRLFLSHDDNFYSFEGSGEK
jgi:type II secretory pathway pseudopilin PulG